MSDDFRDKITKSKIINNNYLNVSNKFRDCLEKKGILSSIQLDVRSKLIKDILHTNQDKPEKNNFLYKINSLNRNDLLVKVACSLINDFLIKNKLNYSLSIFSTELGISNEDFFHENDLTNYFLQKIEKLDPNLNSMICSVIGSLDGIKNRVETESHETQTNLDPNFDLDEKLRLIDHKYMNKLEVEKLFPAKMIEEKNLKFQRELEERLKNDYKNELTRFKEIELSNVRIEERNTFNKKIMDMRDDYERKFLEKLEIIRKREKDCEEKIRLKEQEIEKNLHLQREKFQENLKNLSFKEENLLKSHENEMKKLKLNEDKLNFREKELEIRLQEVNYIQECAQRKIKEEIEQFKLEYDRNHELEIKKIQNKKFNLDEQEFKNNMFQEKYKKMQEDLEKVTSENKRLIEKLKEIDSHNINLRKDNEFIREELKIISGSDKRSQGLVEIKDKEIFALKEEIKILRHSIETNMKINEERKNEQEILLSDLKNKIDDKNQDYKFMKDDFNKEIERLRNYYKDIIENDKNLNHEKFTQLTQQNRTLEEQMNKYKNLFGKANKKLIELGADHEEQIKQPPVPMKINYNFNQNDLSEINVGLKAKDHLLGFSKLEKELEDNKNSMKNLFAQKKEKNAFNPIQSELYEKFMKEKLNEITESKQLIDNYSKIKEGQTKEIVDSIFSQLKKDLVKESIVINENSQQISSKEFNRDNKNSIRDTEKINMNDYIHETNRLSINQDNFEQKNFNNLKSSTNSQMKNDIINYNTPGYGNIDKSQESKKNLNLSRDNNISRKSIDKENIVPISNSNDSKKKDNIDLNTQNYQSKIEEVKKSQGNSNNEMNQLNEKPLKSSEREKEKSIKDSERNNKETSDKQKESDRVNSIQNDLSVGSISSSDGWNSETKKDPIPPKKEEEKKKEVSSKVTPVIKVNNQHIFKEDISPRNKPVLINETVKSNDSNKFSTLNYQNPKHISPLVSHEKNTSHNQSIHNASKIKKPVNSILEEDESRNISNLIDNINNKNESAISSSNRFQNVNYSNYDKKDTEEIKTENEDDEYAQDFEDVDMMSNDFKGGDGFKNASLGYSTIHNNASANLTNILKQQNLNYEPNKNMNISKNSSIVDKVLQSKNSNDDEIEEKFSYESSRRNHFNKDESKRNNIEEDSSLNKYEFSERKKDISRRNESDIKEEIEDDAIEPVDYD